jgi:phosphoglycerate dehydrogenase-like enzyme
MEEDCPLRYVCSVTGSVKPRVPRPFISKGILVTNWGPLVSQAVAEHAMLLVLALLRALPRWRELVETPRTMFEMMPLLRSRTLGGKRVGLHGFGAVARQLVAMLRPYDVELAAFSPGVPKALMDEFGVRACQDLPELFSRSEVLIECEGLNDQSLGAVTGTILRLLPEDAVFVNVGRGAVVDEGALAALAEEGRLRVGLDVVQRESLAPDSPLLRNPRVLLSPHVAGPTWETYPLCGAQVMENLEKFFRGETPDNRVTPDIYDRTT